MDDRPTKEPTPFPSRLEAELNEILSHADREPSPVIKLRSRARRARFRSRRLLANRSISFRATGLNLLILTFALAIASVIIAQGSPFIARFVALASFATLVYLLGRPFIRPRGASSAKRWRGRDINF